VAVVPIWKNEEQRGQVLAAMERLRETLARAGIAARFDDRDNVNPGFKFAEWELLGVPLRLELGPRDVASNQVMAVRRNGRRKEPVSLDAVAESLPRILDEIQGELFEAARARREAATTSIDGWDGFTSRIESEGGFIWARHCGRRDCEQTIQDETKATVRLVPSEPEPDPGPCVRCGTDAPHRVVFAKAY
jgi:prolyl-tRNA synthetase